MTVSLTLFREILALVRTYSESVHLFHQYLSEESSVLGSENTLFATTDKEASEMEEKIAFEESRGSKNIYSTEFQDVL